MYDFIHTIKLEKGIGIGKRYLKLTRKTQLISYLRPLRH